MMLRCKTCLFYRSAGVVTSLSLDPMTSWYSNTENLIEMLVIRYFNEIVRSFRLCSICVDCYNVLFVEWQLHVLNIVLAMFATFSVSNLYKPLHRICGLRVMDTRATF